MTRLFMFALVISLPAVGLLLLLLLAFPPSPDSNSVECNIAMMHFYSAEQDASLSALGGEVVNDAAIELAEIDAKEACGERGFLEAKSRHIDAINKMKIEEDGTVTMGL